MLAKRIDNIFDIVFSILLFSLSLSMAIPNILLGVLLLVFLAKKNKTIFSKRYTKLLLIFVVYIFLKALLFNTFIENFNFYKLLLVLSVLSFLIYNITNITLVIKNYIFGVFIGVIISVFKILIYYFHYKILPFGNTSEVQNLILIHRPYFGFMCLLAVILIDVLLPKIHSKKRKILYLVVAFSIAIFIYIIVARLALLLLVIFLIVRIITYLKQSKSNLILGLIIASVIITGAFTMNENFKNRLYIKSSFPKTIKVLKNQEPRFVIWDCFFNQISDKMFNPYFGYNNRKTIQEQLNRCYNESIINVSKRNYYIKTKFNTHNQFFDVFLEGGIIGLVLFFTLFFHSFFYFRFNFHSLFILCSFFLFFIVENLFHRQLGVYLFGIFIPLFHKIIAVEKK